MLTNPVSDEQLRLTWRAAIAIQESKGCMEFSYAAIEDIELICQELMERRAPDRVCAAEKQLPPV